MIDNYAVNLLFWDQWGFYAEFFDKGSYWVFHISMVHTGKGIGFILAKWIADLSAWDGKIEAFAIGVLLFLSGLFCLLLKKRLTGNLVFMDIVLFALILSPTQHGLFSATPNISHGSMPFLLLILYSFAWLNHSKYKYYLIGFINFLLVFTGFGFFIAPISIFLILLDLWRFKEDRIHKVLSLLLCLFGLVLFFYDYNFNHPQDLAGELENSSLNLYLSFIFVSLANYWSLTISSIWDMVFGAINFMIILGLMVLSTIKLWRETNNKALRIVFILSTFSFLFLLNLSLGRAPYGIGGAKASRYIIYISPAYIALYFYLGQLRFGGHFWKLIFVLASIYPSLNTAQHYKRMEKIKSKKEKWVEVYKKTESIEIANRESNFKIFPKPEKVHLKERLEYLKEHKLNFYKSEPQD